MTAEGALTVVDWKRPSEAELRERLGLLTEEEIATLAGAELRTVRDWRTKRTGPPYTTLGRRPLYRVESFQKWLKEREEETQP